LCVLFEFVDHGGRWGKTARAIDRWQHPVVSSKTLDAMAIEIASDSPAFFVSVDSLLPTTIAT
jgi:hypothetical protein